MFPIEFGSFVNWTFPIAFQARLQASRAFWRRKRKGSLSLRLGYPRVRLISFRKTVLGFANVSFVRMFQIKMVERFGWRRLVSVGRHWQILYAGGGLPRSSEATSLRGSAHRTKSILIARIVPVTPTFAMIAKELAHVVAN